jgi:hypothetical protein
MGALAHRRIGMGSGHGRRTAYLVAVCKLVAILLKLLNVSEEGLLLVYT